MVGAGSSGAPSGGAVVVALVAALAEDSVVVAVALAVAGPAEDGKSYLKGHGE